jgi:hypothetical protein
MARLKQQKNNTDIAEAAMLEALLAVRAKKNRL